MTDNNHTITPPDELVKKWRDEAFDSFPDDENPCPCDIDDARDEYIATQSARWGYEQRGAVNEAKLQKARDVELIACCEEIRDGAGRVYIDESKLRVCLADDIWIARRPKPNSQAEEALQALDDAMIGGHIITTSTAAPTIRAALERLRKLEALDD